MFKNIKAACLSISKVTDELTTKALSSFTKAKYGNKSTVCKVWTNKDKIVFSIIDGPGGEVKIDNNSCGIIRKHAGTWALNVYGPPYPNKINDVPNIVLLPSYSLLKTLGLIKFYKFIRDWKGESMSGEIVVVRYSVIN